MTLKSIATVAAVAALMTASSAMAQTISVDVARFTSGPNNGRVMLDSNGNWVWNVTLNTDADGGAASVEFGANFTGGALVGGAVTLTGEGNGGVEQATAGQPVFGWETLTAGSGGAFPVGLQTNVPTNQAFYANGTGDLAGSSSLLLGTFTTRGPATGTGRSLSTGIGIIGAYDASGNVVGLNSTHGVVGESDGRTGVSASRTVTAIRGDANFDGNVNSTDLSILSGGFNATSGRIWSTGDFSGDGAINSTDLSVLSGNFGFSGTAPVVATPEPAAMALLAMAAGLLFAGRKRV